MNFHNVLKVKYSSWEDLEAAIERIEIAKEKGTAFEEFVFVYFTHFKNLYQISELYMGPNIPAELKAKFKLEKRDSGVDGLIIKENGDSVAYQAKFRSAQAAPSYDELTSFWAESEHTTERCIFANCYELPQQSYKKKDQFIILRDELNSLEPEFFEWLFQFAATGDMESHVAKFSPLPHQEKMIAEVLDGFATSERGKMLAACGTGKTLTSMWIKEELECSTVLFVAPNLALIKQTLEAWMPQSNRPFAYLCVCSDQTVASSAKSDDSDEFQADATYIGVPVTTDSDKIINFLNYDTPKGKVIFSTYQSLDAIVHALQNVNDFRFDIIFFDEAHRTAGNKDSAMFVFGMSDDFIPAYKRLFMTATERFVNPRIVGKAKQYDYEVFSMDNQEQYGHTFSSLSFRDAIDQGIISDYKIVLCCMNEQDIQKIIEENLVLSIGDREIDAQNLFKQVLLGKTMNDIGINKVISYHRNISSAQAFINSADGTSVNEVIASIAENIAPYDVHADHINGTMSAGKRKEIFDAFVKSPYGVISNARCLTEGVDVPIIDAVYFADPKNSIIDIIQAVGRSLRKTRVNPEKISYIIVPVIISDEVAKFEDIDPKNFSTLHSVVQALRDQDRILADYIDKLNLKLATGSRADHGNENPPIIIEVSEQLNIDDFANKLSLRIAEVNRDPSAIAKEFIVTPASRTSGVDRTFKTVGDYTFFAYFDNLIIPTLKKYDTFAIGLPRDVIAIDHNNVSHTKRIGATIEKELKFYVTDVGKAFFEASSPEEYIPIFQEQMLKYYELAPITRIPRFTYRFALKVLSNFESISKFAFVYSLYITKDFGDRGVAEAIDRIKYLQDTYPNIEALNEANKKIVLEALNAKYETSLKLEDIWTSRTTVYNQFNYIKNHLFAWSEIFDITGAKNEIRMLPEAPEKILEILDRSREIETCPMDRLGRIFTSRMGW
jgi:superfamily II DNA or RNA helicase